MVSIKICGITSTEAVEAAIKAGTDYLGFVFFQKSPRNVSAEQAASLSKGLPASVKTVAVCVDSSDRALEGMLVGFAPDYLQLHGQETEARVVEIKQRFGVPVIKAIAVRNGDDIARGMRYSKVADMLLFDAKAPETSVLPGGNGLAFDWNLLAGRSFDIPWMLSGGLNAENVKEAISLSGAKIVDVSSSVEIRPGVKSPALIEAFIHSAKGV